MIHPIYNTLQKVIVYSKSFEESYAGRESLSTEQGEHFLLFIKMCTCAA